MEKKRFSMSSELARETITPEMEARKESLRGILTRNGMELRDDSKMAYNYVRNGGDIRLAAHELLCTNFLFQNTEYDALCQDGLRKVAAELKKKYDILPWKTVWSITREYAVPAMKMYALAESGKTMPCFDVESE